MKRTSWIVSRAIMGVLLFQMLGCATKVVDTRRYFWPLPPDIPRIEWIGTYSNDVDLKQAGFLESITGAEAKVSLDRPVYLAADGMGKVYVTDQKLAGVVVFDLKGKKVEMLGGEDAAAVAGRVSGVALDGEGNVYVGDMANKKILVYSKEHQLRATLDLSKNLKNIGAFAIDKVRKHLVVPDVWDHKIAVFSLDGKLIKVHGKRGDAEGEFSYPTSVAIDKEGNIIVCDSMNARVQRYSPDLKFLSSFGKRGDGIGEFNIIKAVAADSEGHIYVTDGKSHRFSIYNDQGEFLLPIGAPFSAQPGASVTPGGFLLPQGIFIDQNDTIYIADSMNSRFQVFQYLNEKYLKEHPVGGEKAAKQ